MLDGIPSSPVLLSLVLYAVAQNSSESELTDCIVMIWMEMSYIRCLSERFHVWKKTRKVIFRIVTLQDLETTITIFRFDNHSKNQN